MMVRVCVTCPRINLSFRPSCVVCGFGRACKSGGSSSCRFYSKQMLGADVLADLNRTISKSLLGQDVKNQLDAPVSASRLDPVMIDYLIRCSNKSDFHAFRQRSIGRKDHNPPCSNRYRSKSYLPVVQE